jgi:hypothetical protein
VLLANVRPQPRLPLLCEYPHQREVSSHFFLHRSRIRPRFPSRDYSFNSCLSPHHLK